MWDNEDDESEEEEEQRECMMRHFQLVHTELMASYGCDKNTTSRPINKRKQAAKKRRFLLSSEDKRNTAMIEQKSWDSL